MKRMIPIAISIAAIFAAGCATSNVSKPDAEAPQTAATPKGDVTEIEGVWKGVEITPDNGGPATLTVSGQNIEYHGHEDGDWLKGTFTLRRDTTPKQFLGVVTACDDQSAIGKKCYAIYKIDDGTLTISGNAPGESDFPSDFDTQGARTFVFKHGEREDSGK